MADTAASDVSSDGPVLNVINKRLRALRKKYNRIIQMEESLSKGKTLNKEQEETLRSKPAVIVGIDELEKLRDPLTCAVIEEVNLAIQQHQASTSDSAFTASEDSEKKLDSSSHPTSEKEQLMLVEDLLNLLYFGCMFDVKSLQSDFTATMLKRTLERACCLSYDCMPDDESTDVIDLLGERDLDLISMVSGLLISRPGNSPLSHKHALQQCIEHAKLWITKSDQPIVPDLDATYAELRLKLNRIMSSLYFTTDPVKVEAAAANYGSYSVPVVESAGVVPINEPMQDHTLVVQSQQKEEHASSKGTGTDEIQASTVEEIQQGLHGENFSELPPEAEEVRRCAESGDDNLEQRSSRWRSHQNQNYRGNRNGGGGGRRGYSDGRGGRGRGGSYHNGHNQYYDQSSNYYQKSYYNNYRGRGGRSTVGGNYNPHASGGQAGNLSIDS